MNRFENVIQNKYFKSIRFSDDREKNVFLSYIRGFSLLIMDSSVKKILEIGGGQSTALLALFGQRLDWNIITVDMNPDAIALKVRSHTMNDLTLEKVHFRKAVSISPEKIRLFYERQLSKIGGVDICDVLKAASSFVDTSIDARKVPSISRALGLQEFSTDGVLNAIQHANYLAQELLDVFRTPGDELEFYPEAMEPLQSVLQEIMDMEDVDAVFLDSGEFSSLPEWEIVEAKLRPGGYVILHDIFFPKSFKNWLVCSSIVANPKFETLYIDRSTPQGLMIAQKKI